MCGYVGVRVCVVCERDRDRQQEARGQWMDIFECTVKITAGLLTSRTNALDHSDS